MRRSKLFLSAFVMVASACVASAQYARPAMTRGVGIDQKLNSQIPLDVVFRNEAGQAVPIRAYFGDKPVVLALVYYNCPSLCNLTLTEMVHSLHRVTLEPGRDYNVVVASIDPKETPQLAAEKKANYAQEFGRVAAFNAGWHFLTGSQDSISRLASVVGFKYRWDEPTHQFVHAAGIMVATPEGKLSRYLYGIQFAPADMRLSLVEASQHKIGSPVDYILLFCCRYDPITGKYTLVIYNILKLAGAVTLLILGGVIWILMRNDKKKRSRTEPAAVEHVH